MSASNSPASPFAGVLSGLVANAAEKNASAVAAICDDAELTWSELDQRVRTLVAALRQVGVSPGDRVGIYLHKSLDSLVAVHGILSAGAIYVPIDPLASAELVSSIVASCGVRVLVTHEPRRDGLNRFVATTDLTAVVGIGGSEIEAESVAAFSWDEVESLDPVSPLVVAPDDVAYVMYTSGSTGRPKGITHTHRSGFAYADMAAKLYALSPEDRMANFSPLHFDMSTFEVLAGIHAGSSVVMLSEPLLRFPASLTSYLVEQRCTVWYTVPSLMQQMVTRGGLADQDLSAVRWVNPAGEVFAPEALAQFMALFPNARFSNVYGPAEVNQCTYYHFDEPPSDGRPVPIGFASGDAELLLVDDDLQPVGAGTQGELLVSASTMAEGYWEQPELTAAAFIERAEPDGTLKRWHRTGDLLELDEDGLLRFHGRRDHQVKVRGNRVELEGVEAAVGDLDGVENAVVGVRTDPMGNAQLVSFYTLDQSAKSEVDHKSSQSEIEKAGPPTLAWRKRLGSALPAYAVPVEFVVVDEFPLTPSGKIDRRAVRGQIASGDSGDS